MNSPEEPFAVLQPDNPDAWALVSNAVEHMKDQNFAQQLSFFMSDTVPINDLSAIEEAARAEVRPKHQGKYTLSIGNAPEHNGSLGWRVGKGIESVGQSPPELKNVDLLIARPRDPLASRISPTHFLIQIHPISGALMVQPVGEQMLEYSSLGRWTPINKGERMIIHSRETRLRLGRESVFKLSLIAKGTQQAMISYRKQINRRLEDLTSGRMFDYMTVGFLPGPDCIVFERHRTLLQHTNIGIGTFASAHKALSLDSGMLLAVKAQFVKSKSDLSNFQTEFRIGERAKEKIGLMHSISFFCEHDMNPHKCEQRRERVFFSMPLAFSSFSSARSFWPKISWGLRLPLFKQTLQGVQELHSLGYMHRDIQIGNMVIESLHPPVARICDFGKATSVGTGIETALGPVPTCAPEVWNGHYTQEIDLWSWAIATASVMMMSVYPDSRQDCYQLLGLRGRINQGTLAAVQQNLDDARKEIENAIPCALIDLLKSILKWNIEDRPSLKDSLDHPCWAILEAEECDEDTQGNAQAPPPKRQQTEAPQPQIHRREAQRYLVGKELNTQQAAPSKATESKQAVPESREQGESDGSNLTKAFSDDS